MEILIVIPFIAAIVWMIRRLIRISRANRIPGVRIGKDTLVYQNERIRERARRDASNEP